MDAIGWNTVEVREYYVECNDCGKAAPTADTELGCVLEASAAGWKKVEIDGEDLRLCPDCIESRKG
ncbi:MAG: hypothetical protein PHS46_08045 [Candidatus Omnitrophica bacterium]|nr:hypothetical protein [Candidatus Omnitrophota bacterium]